MKVRYGCFLLLVVAFIAFKSVGVQSCEKMAQSNSSELIKNISTPKAVEKSEKVSKVLDWEIQLIDGPDNYVYYIGDVVKAALVIKESAYDTQRIDYRLVDINQNIVWQASHTLEIDKLPVRDVVEFSLKNRGIYRLEARLAEREVLPLEMVIGAIAPIGKQKMPYFESPYGMSPILDDYHLAICRAGGISWLRLHDMDLATYWAHVEPEKDVWQWRDEEVKKAVDAGYYILGGFEATPPWASDAPESLKKDAQQFYSDDSIWRMAWGYPPKNLDDLYDYVYRTVQHYKGSIRAWEVWNEPHVDLFWKGSVDEYVAMSKVCYKAAKAADPNCIIVGGGGLSIYALNWIEAVMKGGLLDYLDVFSIHGYADDAITPANVENMGGSIGRIREMMRKYGVEKPIWISESGFSCESFFSDPELHTPSFSMANIVNDAGNVVRGYVTCISAGVEKFFWWRLRHWDYSYHAIHEQESLVEYTRAPKATFYALAGLTERLGGANFKQSLDLAPYVSCKLFEGNSNATAVVWVAFALDKDAMLSVDSSSSLALYDLMGNPMPVQRIAGKQIVPVSHRPYYIVLDGGTAKDLAKLLTDATVENLNVNPDNVQALRKNAEREEFLQSQKESFAYTHQVKEDSWFKVDLRSHVNMGFKDDVPNDGQGGWTDGGPLNDMRDMPMGDQLFCGVPFDIIEPQTNNEKAVITLYSAYLSCMPKEVKGIQILRQASRLYFLHSSSWSEKRCDLMVYRIHYENGEIVELPIASTVNNGDWWLAPEPGEVSHVVAIPTFNSGLTSYRIKYLRIYEWINPHPEWVIKHFDVISQGSGIPIVIAVTGVK